MKNSEYFEFLQQGLKNAMDIAQAARSRGLDPSTEVEIPLAVDLAERVEKLIGIPGIAVRIREMETEGMSREESALAIGIDFAEGRLGKGATKIQSVENAIRTSVAILTEGVVAAPMEGIARVDLGKNDDGTEYLKVYYAGPIRSAGGTAQALSVLVADYVRRAMGIAPWKPRPEEVERYVEEIGLYKRVAGLQYSPSDDEIRIIVRNCPICIEGEPTEEEEVSGYRDLPRIETNRVRGGIALVSAEGIALKRPKLKKHVTKLGITGWEWLDSLASGKKDGGDSTPKFLRDLIAGRPVFSHPSRPGGFRLRYGRARNTGLAAAGINPATMLLLGEFMAAGTQIKVEQPGKAAAVAPVNSIEGPTVRLLNGDVVRFDADKDILEWMPISCKDPRTIHAALKAHVSSILDIGEILISYGEFLENNRPLAVASYVFEWWAEELLKAGGDPAGKEKISGQQAIALSREFGVPLHPAYTFLWHDLPMQEFESLASLVFSEGRLELGKLLLPMPAKGALETLLVLHKVRAGRIIIEDPLPLLLCLGLEPDGEALKKCSTNLEEDPKNKDNVNGNDADASKVDESIPDGEKKECFALGAVNKLSGLVVRARAPTRIGARMGRPEKSDIRLMRPPPHVLFPAGEEGGKSRSIQEAAKHSTSNTTGIINVEIEQRVCKDCGKTGFSFRCECGGYTEKKRVCPKCNIPAPDKCPKCGKDTTAAAKMQIDVKKLYHQALERLGERDPESLKGVLGLSSRDKTPEPLEKGILRAKHGINIFKDGTVRYDLTDLPLTHFRPDEIGTSPEILCSLGYTEDMHGQPLTTPDQVCELRVQDIILAVDAGQYLLKVAKFIDELLVKFYGLAPYYNAIAPSDLIGTLMVGLAPHTSAGVLCRLIGYSPASAGFGHPFFHAAKRRNCDGDEDCVMLLMDALLNFSMSYLPAKRGGKMDACLVMTTILNPSEVDKEAHNLDLTVVYPLEFYEATLLGANPKDLEKKFDLVSKRLGSDAQYEGFNFSHSTTDIAAGPKNSAYKTLVTMVDKMDAQLELGRMIRAVDEQDVAERVINSHFLPDLIGNLHAFSKQKVRCVKCGAKFRRPPLKETCPKCGGRIILTVHEGSVRKYLEVSIKVAEEYGVSSYTKQRLQLLKIEINSLFKNDKAKQTGLADFM
ncbi:MAG: DNA polymerase II large subunit [Methanothrix sp.]|jgi:DNA polymerase II large subunit|nr:DNA polymerase II large subunit [Methanothrix sp.]